MRAIVAHPDYVPGMGFVAQIDGSRPPDTAYLLETIEFVEQHAAHFLDCRWANVSTNLAHYGMTRVAQARVVQARVVQARVVQARVVQARVAQARVAQARVAQARLRDVPSILGIFSTVAEAVAWVNAPPDEATDGR
jgi:hypothetical protein